MRDNLSRGRKGPCAWWDYGHQIARHRHRTFHRRRQHMESRAHCDIRPYPNGAGGRGPLASHGSSADYVFVWAGGGGDDLAKSPHLARIGNSATLGTARTRRAQCSASGRTAHPPRWPTRLLYKMVMAGHMGVSVNEHLL